MTRPEDTEPADGTPDGAAETGALAAASTEDEEATDPLAPLDALTSDDQG